MYFLPSSRWVGLIAGYVISMHLCLYSEHKIFSGHMYKIDNFWLFKNYNEAVSWIQKVQEMSKVQTAQIELSASWNHFGINGQVSGSMRSRTKGEFEMRVLSEGGFINDRELSYLFRFLFEICTWVGHVYV